MRAALTDLDEIVDRLARVISASVADDTEITWVESVRGEAALGRQAAAAGHFRAVSVRVWEGGRPGNHLTGSGTATELEAATRLALAHSRAEERPPARRAIPGPELAVEAPEGLYDPEVAALTASAAEQRLRSWTEGEETGRLTWSETQLVVANSRGLVQRLRATGAALTAGTGRGPRAATARGAARSLAALGPEELFARARRRASCEPVDQRDLDTAERPVVLAPEAAAELVALLNRAALSAEAFREGHLLSTEDLGQRRFSLEMTLRDDGTAVTGLPLPCDLAGEPKAPIDLIRQGTFATPAVDAELAARLGRPLTPHYLAAGETRASHLFLLPGAAAEEEVFAAADGGVWIARLADLALPDPALDGLRARVPAARAIAGGRLGAALPPLVWEDRLSRVFAELVAVGRETTTLPLDGEMLGGVTAPALALAAGGRLRLAP